MLRQLQKGWVNLIKGATPSSNQIEHFLTRQLSSTASLAAQAKSFDRKKDAVRQGGSQDDRSNIRGQDAEVPYEKFKSSTFPSQETFSKVFSGVAYSQLPVIHIKATYNNTIISATNSDGEALAIQSGGTVGFRNARRGTNVAAQAAAIALARDVLRKDIHAARVCLKGIGPGRLPALKAIQLSGVDVVSITDTTPLPHNGNRPKKVRRL